MNTPTRTKTGIVHITTKILPGTAAGQRKTTEGIVFHPSNMLEAAHPRAQELWEEFFSPGHEYKTICLKTEMGPGELTYQLQVKCGIASPMCIGGLIAPFRITNSKLDSFWKTLSLYQHSFYQSLHPDQDLFGQTLIDG